MPGLRIWFISWLAAMVLLVALPTEARRAGPLYAGTCVEGQPVLERWDPVLSSEFQPACRSGSLTLAPAEGQQPLTPPSDFAAWAFVRLNGQRLYNPYHDAYPYVKESTGEVLLPLRLVVEAMGGRVAWIDEAESVEVTWRGRRITLSIGSADAAANGQEITLEQAPVLWMDRTMVSPGVIAKLFGAEVNWEPDTQQLQIRRAGILCSPALCIKAT